MAISLSVGQVRNAGNQTKVPVTATFSSTYATGGETITAAALGLSVIQDVALEDSGGYSYDAILASDGSSFKLKAWKGASGTISAPTASYTTRTWAYMKGSANTDQESADQASTPTNGALLKALAAADNTTALTPTTQPDYPRNICVVIKNNEGAAAHNLVASNYTVVGTYNGQAQTEVIAFTDTSSVAATKFRYKYGVKPYDSVTSVTPSAAQAANMQHSLGVGSKMGLARSLFTPAEADVVKLTAQGANVAISSIVDTTNNTINTGTRTDNDHVSVKYAAKGYDAAPTMTGSVAEVSGSFSQAIGLVVYGY